MLRKVQILPFYDSKTNDIIDEFYVPALSECVIYKRVSAYFDSNIVSRYSVGIENIVRQNGRIQFIFSNQLSEYDFEIIKNGYEEREIVFERLASQVDTQNVSIELKNLGYLIKNGYVDIKIAFTKDGGLFHDKFGLMIEGTDVLYFRGSNNETLASVTSNFESFETTCSWKASKEEMAKLLNAEKTFELLWENDYSDEIIVIDVPSIVARKLASYSADRLILTHNDQQNCFVLDYIDNRFLAFNKLLPPQNSLLSPEYFFYKRCLEAFVETISVEGNMVFSLETKLNHMRRIISAIADYSVKNDFSFHVTPALRKHLNDYDIKIDHRRLLGMAIKRRDSRLKEDFDYFNSIVCKEMSRTLRIPQVWGSYHLWRMSRAANFSVPGSGKTSIVYGAFAFLSSNEVNEISKIVVIGPKSSFKAWREEFAKCFGDKKDLRVFDYQRQKQATASLRYDQITYYAKHCNLLLINYESLQGNIAALREVIDSRTVLVFDEVHRVKAINGVRSNASLKIIERARYRFVLTGTPIPNGYRDMFVMFNIMFSEEYHDFFGFEAGFLDEAKTDELKQSQINEAIFPFFQRTTKEDLLIPPPEPDDIKSGYVIGTPNEERLFFLLHRAFSHNFFMLYIRLLQASNNPRLILNAVAMEDVELVFSSDEYFAEEISFGECDLFSEEEIEFILSFDMTTKFHRGIELVEELVANGPVVVWAIFISTIQEIYQALTRRGVRAKVITGRVNNDERERLIDEFLNGEFDVIITNPHTLGESVSLHSRCHQAVYFEYSLDLVHMLQSRDRIHRLGLSHDQRTNYYYMVLDLPESDYKPIDLLVYERLLEKRELQDKALSDENIVFSEEDITADIAEILRKVS